MIKKLIQNFLGITELKVSLFNLDNDIVTIMDKQMGQEKDVIDADEPPECDKNSPYEYVTQAQGAIRTEPGSVNYAPEWYCIWFVGFAGPFPSEEEAKEYKDNMLIKNCHVEQLHRHLFVRK